MKKPNSLNFDNSNKNFTDEEKLESTNSKNEIESSLNELKQLEETLSFLMKSNKNLIAEKYLNGFLESKNASDLQDYLDNLK